MPYIGKEPVIGEFIELDALTASATADYALTRNGAAYKPATVNNLLVSINGVIQAGSTMSLSGNTLTVGATLSSSDTIDFVRVLGSVGNVSEPTDGSVTSAKLATNAVRDTMPSGSILQIQSVNKVDNQRIVGTTFTDVMSVSITPTSANSKILVMCGINISCSGGDNYDEGQRYSGVKLYRDSTQIAVNTDKQSSQTAVWFSSNQVQATSSGYGMMNSGGTFIDTPSTTSEITYKVKAANSHSAVQTFINRPSKTNNAAFLHQGTSNLTVMEIAG